METCRTPYCIISGVPVFPAIASKHYNLRAPYYVCNYILDYVIYESQGMTILSVCTWGISLIQHRSLSSPAGGWKWNRGLGNKSLTSKRHYMYQRLDGEASISCHWQKVSRQSQIIWSPWLRHRPITRRLFQIVLTTRGGSCVQVTAGVLRFVQKIYRVTYVFLCGVSFISFVESQFLVYV